MSALRHDLRRATRRALGGGDPGTWSGRCQWSIRSRRCCPMAGLVRGKAVACGGVAAMSLAVSLAVAATASGSWLAVVGVPTFGLEAAEEFGIPLERVVRVDPPPAADNVGESWAELVAATFDGFEVVITKVPQRLNAVLARRVQSRLQAREGVLDHARLARILRPSTSSCAPKTRGGKGSPPGRDICAVAVSPSSSSGRRVQRQRQVSLWLPDDGGTVARADPVARSRSLTRTRGDDADRAIHEGPDAHGVVGALAGRRRRHQRRCSARPSGHRAGGQPRRRLFAAAAATGVSVGLRRRVAQQRCPEAVLLDHQPDRDARVFDAVVRAVNELTPRLEIVEPGWLCVEARGPSRYFGGDERLGAHLVVTIGQAARRSPGSHRIGDRCRRRSLRLGRGCPARRRHRRHGRW